MLSRISVALSVVVFVFWWWGIIADPQKAPIACWAAWTVISFSVAMSRVYAKQPTALWFVWGIGNILTIFLILLLGGQNWGFEKNAVYLGIGTVALIFSLIFGKRFPKTGEFLGGLSLACAYVSQIMEWVHVDNAVPIGLIFAAAISTISPILLGIHSRKEVGAFGIGNIFAAVSAGFLLVVLLGGERRRKIRVLF